MIRSFDPKCWDLADAFLDDVQGSTGADRDELATIIQEAVEDYCNAFRPDCPSVTRSGGHFGAAARIIRREMQDNSIPQRARSLAAAAQIVQLLQEVISPPTEDGSQSGGEPREDGSISRRAATNSPTITILPGGKP